MTTPPELAGYTVDSFIGSGGSADVWRVSTADGTQLAAKVFRESGEASGRAEWRSMRRHAGAHVMPVIDYVRDKSGRSVLLMPYQGGGSLHDIVTGRGGLTAGECVTALAPIAQALARIHDGGCLHADVTPKNILFDIEGRPVLSDLGAARVTALPGQAEWGSAGYVAPEVLDGHAPAASSDVYSLAAVAWFALVGEAPAPASLRPHLSDLVPDVPESLERLIAAGLSLTPSARPYSDDVARRLLDAARPVAVPLDREAPGEDGSPAPVAADTITRRLRQEAQKRQMLDSRRSANGTTLREGRRRPRPTVSAGAGRAVLGGAAALGLGLLGAAALWPTSAESGDREAEPSATGGSAKPYAVHAVTTPPSATPVRPTTAGAPPTRADLEGLLKCRALAWNRGEVRALDGCLAAKSPARTSDESALAQAQEGKIRYSGITYSVASFTLLEGHERDRARATATVERSGYTVTRGASNTQMGRATTRVELRFVQSGGAWRISEWNGR